MHNYYQSNNEQYVWYQARNQKFFREGEVSWNQGTLINISLKNTRKKGPAEKNLGVFSPRYSKNYTLNRNFNSKMNKIRAIFFQIRALFSIFKKGQGSPPPSSPPSCAPGYELYEIKHYVPDLLWNVHLILAIQEILGTRLVQTWQN